MLKISLVTLFLAIMSTLTIAASSMPVPPEIAGNEAVLVAELG